MDTKLPKWLHHRYSLLRDSFRDNEFNRDDAVKLLAEKNRDDEKTVTAILSELKKAGWLEIRLDPEDARRSIYKLKNEKEIISRVLSVGEKLTRNDIEGLLKIHEILVSPHGTLG